MFQKKKWSGRNLEDKPFELANKKYSKENMIL